jgi:SAM-dependent methyltransferase
MAAPFRRFPATPPTRLDGGDLCLFCGVPMEPSQYGFCTNCDSRPRVRALSPLLREAIAPRLNADLAARLPILAFAAVRAEQELLQPVFPKLLSASLFGTYGKGHHTGVDARDLSRYADASFSGHYSCLLFDYFTEHEKALAEAYRVLAPGGVFLTHIQYNRLIESAQAPWEKSVIKSKAGYYEYIPADQQMQNILVGADWFLNAMTRAGFSAQRYTVTDRGSVMCDWFVGWK